MDDGDRDGAPTLPPTLRTVGEVVDVRLDPRTTRAVAPVSAATAEEEEEADGDAGCGTGFTSRPGASRRGSSEEDHRS